MGDITPLDRPGDHAPTTTGLVLPDEPINVVYRVRPVGHDRRSSTTSSPTTDAGRLRAVGRPQPAARPNVRIIQLDSAPDFAPKTQAFNGSDQIAQYIASDAGMWSIGYDEFGYAKTYERHAGLGPERGRASGCCPTPRTSRPRSSGATLRPDLSQELSGVYTSPNPLAYPISAYSYIVTQCAPAGDRPTCKGAVPQRGRHRDARASGCATSPATAR